MKKIITLLTMSILLVSCGNTAVENDTTIEQEQIIIEDTMMEEVMDEEIMEEETVADEPMEEVLSEEEINAAVEELFNSLED